MSGWSNVGATVVQAVTVIIQTGTANSGIFVYNGVPGTGNLIGSWTATSGTDIYGNAYQAGLTVGETSQSYMLLNPNASNAFNSGTLQAALQLFTTDVNQMMPSMVGSILFNPGAANQQMSTVLHSPIGSADGFGLVLSSDSDNNATKGNATLGTVTVSGMAMTYTPLVTFDESGNIVAQSLAVYSGSSSQVVVLFGTAGETTWTAPLGVTTAKVECWGAGGGGQGGSGAGGGGGEYAAEATLSVTPGTTYDVFVGTGGTGGPGGVGGAGTAGSRSTFQTIGGTILVVANGGAGSNSSTTAGGTGSTNSVHFNGGGSHANTTGVSHGGAGGGSSAGISSVGTTGGSNTGQTGGVGGAAPTGGGSGGNGGNGTGSSGSVGIAGSTPGGGGGTGGAGSTSNSAGGAGASGQVRITYTPVANSLVASISGVAFTDSSGNAIPAGLTGTHRSVTTVGSPDAAQIVPVSGASGVGTGFATVPFVRLIDSASASDVDGHIPGSWIRTTNTGALFTWQTPTGLGTGWALGPSSGTVQNLQYRFDAENNLVMIGAIHSTSTTPAATVFTLPSAYRPAITQRGSLVSNSGGVATARFFEINSNGGVLVMANLTTSGTDVYFNATVPLGNIA